MNEIFRHLNTAYNNNNFEIIVNHRFGSYFLKLRSLSRVEILKQLAQRQSIDIQHIQGRQLLEYLFCQHIPEESVNEYIEEIYQQERSERIRNEENLYTQLFRLSAFNWGGFYQNAVEQTIVNNYVKKIQDYNQLIKSVDNDLTPRLKNYVLCSWYNHWSSILIEDIFKDHQDILPAVGLVKKVDFFWKNFPFDLKVTYFPDGFMRLKRTQRGLRPEITELKAFARRNNIPYDRNASDNDIYNELLLRITENPNREAMNFISQFHQTRREIIDETIANPNELLVWFYENQGTRRFDAANRFFLVLIDRNNLEESWKLKRNRDILQPKINNFLSENNNVDFKQFQLDFNWEGNVYHSFATCLFIIKE